jgi:type VI secretion system protein
MNDNKNMGSLLNPAAARRRDLLVLGLAALLAGCKTVSGAVDGARSMVGLGPKPVTPDWKSLALRADDDANANSAIALDIVFVRDTAVLDALAAMPATKWFASRADLQRGFPDALTVLSFELVPGQTVKVQDKLWRDAAGWGVLAFAGYPGPGEHRARLLLDAPGYLIQLGAQGFSAIDLKPGAAK